MPRFAGGDCGHENQGYNGIGPSLLFSSLVFYSIPPRGEAAFAPVRIVRIAAVSMSRNCEAGIMDFCSSVTSFLEEEAKADAGAKACKKNCNWKKRKDDLIDAARKKAKDSCARGEAPDINGINKGLDGNAKDRLKKLYDSNSRMFDGTAKLASKDFDVKPNQSPAVTGKGGQVTDLKSAEPSTPKLNVASEFGLANPSKLLASTNMSVPPCPTPGEVRIGTCTCRPYENKDLGYNMCQSDCYAAIANQCTLGGIGGGWDKFIAGAKKYWEDVKTVFTNPGELVKALWDAIKKFGKDAWTVLTNPGELVKDLAGKAWDKIRPGRPLTLAEKNLLKNGSGLAKGDYLKKNGGLFGDSLDYNKIRIVRTHLSFGSPRTVGNTIYLPDKVKAEKDGKIIKEPVFNPDGSLTEAGQAVLIHETGHVWQNQNTDNSFGLIWKTAKENVLYVGRRETQYEWRDDALQGIPFEKLRVEQQARLMEDLAFMPHGDFLYKGKELRQYALDALKEVRQKKGAP